MMYPELLVNLTFSEKYPVLNCEFSAYCCIFKSAVEKWMQIFIKNIARESPEMSVKTGKMNTANRESDKRSLYQPLVKNLVDAFADRLKAVVLFGSQARSTSILKRDHDVLIIIDNLPKNPLQRLKSVRKTIFDIPLKINFIAKTPEEVEANLTPLMLEVCVDGIVLHGKTYFEEYRRRGLQALKKSGLKRKRVGKEWYWQFPTVPEKDWELTWDGYRELP